MPVGIPATSREPDIVGFLMVYRLLISLGVSVPAPQHFFGEGTEDIRVSRIFKFTINLYHYPLFPLWKD
jgi:hypothetical protein